MRKSRKPLLALIVGLLLVAFFYIFIWEDNGEAELITSRHHLVANSKFLKQQDEHNLPGSVLKHPDQSLHKGSDMKTGERLPQGVVNEGPDSDESDVLVEDEEVRGKRRASEYCGPPEGNLKGDEGKAPDGYTLKHVHIVIRHGDRSPLYGMPGYELPWISCDVNITMAKTDAIMTSYLTTMKTIWSKLDKNSNAYRFGLYPHSRYCLGAQLTGTGALQHIRNGQYLNSVYIDKWKFFDADMISRHLKVITTEVSRTYQSAIAFLFGFLPVFDLKKIPMAFSRSMTFCSPAQLGFSCDCLMANRLEVIVKKEYNRRIKNNTLHNEIKRTVAEVLNVPQRKLPWLAALSDVFTANACHDIKLPCSKVDPNSCLDWATVGKLWEFLDFNGASLLSSYAYQRQQRLLIHPLLHIILHRMQNVSRGVESSKVVLYSGHDKTVTPLVAALGIHDGHWPRYSSRVIFELYSKEEGSKHQNIYYIRVLFNGEDKTKQVRFCKGKTIDGLCPLSYFQNFVFHEDLQYFGKRTYKEACEV